MPGCAEAIASAGSNLIKDSKIPINSVEQRLINESRNNPFGKNRSELILDIVPDRQGGLPEEYAIGVEQRIATAYGNGLFCHHSSILIEKCRHVDIVTFIWQADDSLSFFRMPSGRVQEEVEIPCKARSQTPWGYVRWC